MNKSLYRQDLGLFILRFSLGLFLFLAGVGKVQGELQNGLGSFYRSAFVMMQPSWMPEWLGMPYGYALPWLELLVGGLLVLGLMGRSAAIAGTLMMASFTIAHVLVAGNLTGIADGEQGIFHTNYMLTAGWLTLALIGCGNWSVDHLVRHKQAA